MRKFKLTLNTRFREFLVRNWKEFGEQHADEKNTKRLSDQSNTKGILIGFYNSKNILCN